jgi:hypothetical protein
VAHQAGVGHEEDDEVLVHEVCAEGTGGLGSVGEEGEGFEGSGSLVGEGVLRSEGEHVGEAGVRGLHLADGAHVVGEARPRIGDVEGGFCGIAGSHGFQVLLPRLVGVPPDLGNVSGPVSRACPVELPVLADDEYPRRLLPRPLHESLWAGVVADGRHATLGVLDMPAPNKRSLRAADRADIGSLDGPGLARCVTGHLSPELADLGAAVDTVHRAMTLGERP